MKDIKKIMVSCLFALVFLLGGLMSAFNNLIGVKAEGITQGELIHQKTKIYHENSLERYEGCEDYSEYVTDMPSITVLTHG